MRSNGVGALLVGASWMLTGCAGDEEPPVVEAPCAERSGGLELCLRQVGAPAAEATSTLVILPTGPGLSSSYLHSLADTLADTEIAAAEGHQLPSLRVITFDPRGTGATGHPTPPSYMLHEYADDLEAVREKAGAGPIHILAHGWSALVAYHYLRVYPQNVRSLIFGAGFAPRVAPNQEAQSAADGQIEHLQSQMLIPNPLPPANGDDCNPPFAAALPAFFSYWPGEPPEELRVTACSVTARDSTTGAIANTPYDYSAETTAFAGPTLVVYGKSDKIGQATGNAVAASFPLSAPAPAVLPDTGHYLWLEPEVGSEEPTYEFEGHVWGFLAANP